jgi:hypothetical protein
LEILSEENLHQTLHFFVEYGKVKKKNIKKEAIKNGLAG